MLYIHYHCQQKTAMVVLVTTSFKNVFDYDFINRNRFEGFAKYNQNVRIPTDHV